MKNRNVRFAAGALLAAVMIFSLTGAAGAARIAGRGASASKAGPAVPESSENKGTGNEKTAKLKIQGSKT